MGSVPEDHSIANDHLIRNDAEFQSILDKMDLVIAACKLTLLSCNLEFIRRQLHQAKTNYAAMLLKSGRFSMTADNVLAFDSKSAELENVLVCLEGFAESVTEPTDDRPARFHA